MKSLKQGSITWKGLCAFIVISVTSTVLLSDLLRARSSVASQMGLPEPHSILELTNAYEPVTLKGLHVDPDNPFLIQFLLDKNDNSLSDKQLKEEALKLSQYFLASLAVPDEDVWVNLSPYESDRILPDSLQTTAFGQTLLQQDYILKHLSSSLTFPKSESGKNFWNKINSLKAELSDSFSKIWIVPQSAEVFENENSVILGETKLDVLNESDYLALQLNKKSDQKSNDVYAQQMREHILPLIKQEINQGELFAELRALYASHILANWYKTTIIDSYLNKVYSNRRNTKSVSDKDEGNVDLVFSQYKKIFEKGVYDFIKKEHDINTGKKSRRRYISGGCALPVTNKINRRRLTASVLSSALTGEELNKAVYDLKMLIGLDPKTKNRNDKIYARLLEFGFGASKKEDRTLKQERDYLDNVLANEGQYSKLVSDGHFANLNFDSLIKLDKDYFESFTDDPMAYRVFRREMDIVAESDGARSVERKWNRELLFVYSRRVRGGLQYFINPGDEKSFKKSYVLKSSNKDLSEKMDNFVVSHPDGFPGQGYTRLNENFFKKKGNDLVAYDVFYERMINSESFFNGISKNALLMADGIQELNIYSYKSANKVVFFVKDADVEIFKNRNLKEKSTKFLKDFKDSKGQDFVELSDKFFKQFDKPTQIKREFESLLKGPTTINGDMPIKFKDSEGEEREIVIYINHVNDKGSIYKKKYYIYKEDSEDFQNYIIEAELKENELELYEKYDLVNELAVFDGDAASLLQWLLLTRPDILPQEQTKIVKTYIKGIEERAVAVKELLEEYEETLDDVQVSEVSKVDENGNYVVVKGTVNPKQVQELFATGHYTRTIKFDKDGNFEVKLPLLENGDVINYQFFGVRRTNKKRTAVEEVPVSSFYGRRTHKDLIDLLPEKTLDNILASSERSDLMTKITEQLYVKRINKDREKGFARLDEVIAAESNSKKRKMLEKVREKLIAVDELDFSNVLKDGVDVLFYQKYAVYEIRRLMELGDPGVLLALEQGSGKTFISLLALIDEKKLVVTPNSLMHLWGNEARKFFKEQDLFVLDGKYSQRDKLIAENYYKNLVVSKNYLRGLDENKERQVDLSSADYAHIYDEGDSLGNENSKQSKGMQLLAAKFMLIVSATPFVNREQLRSLLKVLYPNDSRFSTNAVFEKSFKEDSVEDANILRMMLMKYLIRFRKKDLFEYYDSGKVKKGQVGISRENKIPTYKFGGYEIDENITMELASLFSDFHAWNRRHGYPYKNDGFGARRAAIKRVMNGDFTKYDSLEEKIKKNSRYKEVNRIVKHIEKNRPEEKIILFFEGAQQVKDMMAFYKDKGAVGYHADVPKDSEGFAVDRLGRTRYFKVDDHGDFVLKQGKPVDVSEAEGIPMPAIEYSKLLFENDPDTKMIILTYKSGAYGHNLGSAANVIFGDSPDSYKVQYQAAERANRLNPQSRKAAVNHYHIEGKYSSEILEFVANKYSKKFQAKYFDSGSYDKVNRLNLYKQSFVFNRILDGIGEDKEYKSLEKKVFRKLMPFLTPKSSSSSALNDLKGGIDLKLSSSTSSIESKDDLDESTYKNIYKLTYEITNIDKKIATDEIKNNWRIN